MKTLKFKYTKSFGNDRFYPLDDYSKEFMKIFRNQSTLTLDQYTLLKKLEFNVEVIASLPDEINEAP